MTTKRREQMRDWVDNWKKAGKAMETLRRKEIRSAKLAETIPLFDGALRSALWLSPAKPTSGLVEFHILLAKTR